MKFRVKDTKKISYFPVQEGPSHSVQKSCAFLVSLTLKGGKDEVPG